MKEAAEQRARAGGFNGGRRRFGYTHRDIDPRTGLSSIPSPSASSTPMPTTTAAVAAPLSQNVGGGFGGAGGDGKSGVR